MTFNAGFPIVAVACLLGTPVPLPADEPVKEIDATTLTHKVLCGYQGWFRCPGDGTTGGWKHWSRAAKKLDAASLTFEMWPDLAESGADEKYPASPTRTVRPPTCSVPPMPRPSAATSTV